jgi:uncharacterized protein
VLPGNDVVRETYMVAFSLTMPYLEPYLIRTFRSVADDITDAGLAADVREFIGQEAQHFQNHRRINEIIKRQLGPAVAAELQAVEDRLDADYRRFNTSKSRRFNLVYAEGFEAMTCAMALTSIAEAEAGNNTISPGPWGQLWAWHLAEEMEHRTVAFDLYEHLEGSYPHRVIGSLRAQWHFQRTIDRLQRILLASQGAPAKRHLPPWMRAGRSRYLATFKPGYDPGRLDPGPIPALILSQYPT